MILFLTYLLHVVMGIVKIPLKRFETLGRKINFWKTDSSGPSDISIYKLKFKIVMAIIICKLYTGFILERGNIL